MESDKKTLENKTSQTVEAIKTKYATAKSASKSFGSIAVSILGVLIGLIVLNDIFRVIKYFYKYAIKRKTNIRRFIVKPKPSVNLKTKQVMIVNKEIKRVKNVNKVKN